MAIVNSKDCDSLFILDPMFQRIHAQYGPPPNWSRPPGFVSLSRIILEQQVSLASANAHFEKLNTYLPAFTPGHILRLSDAEMRACQISRQKSGYLRALAHDIITGQLNLVQLDQMDHTTVRTHLTRIRGIGHWTADIYLMFCLQSKDIFPLGDIAVVKTVKELTTATSPEEITALAATWRPYRSLAAYYCWHYYLCKRGRA
jgi:DNA-3-methyladenine glycosylase II